MFKFNITFQDLYSLNGLQKIDTEFRKFLSLKNPQLAESFFSLTKYEATILLDVSKVLEDFIVELFDIKKENDALKKQHEDLEKIYYVKREFVQRFVAKKYPSGSSSLAFGRGSHESELDGKKILQNLKIDFIDVDDLEKKLADKIFPLLPNINFSSLEPKPHEILGLTAKDDEVIVNLTEYAVWALYSKDGKAFHKNGSLFILPQKTDFQNLVKEPELRNREGFNLTDNGFNLNRALGEANYCIFCHKQDKDSCRKGLCEKNSEVKKDPLGIELKGCPLDQKISEMNLLKSEGFSIGSLATAIIDNPMIAGTGSRICNDCMKSCIYQKQDAVDIPQIETRTLKDVLQLPYGFEIYSLLTRWNPLNIESPTVKKNSGKKVLVCGLGPAGYTLAHYLMNEGHEVVAIDGLKIEPLDPIISGIDALGNRCEFKPIKFLEEIYEPLSTRLIQGFGGVAEYGITARWDKNFLKIIRLLLERRNNFRMFGGLRFGSSIDIETAVNEYGFDHVAVCIGAGKPNIINLENNFAKGIRQASDFLMALQLQGAFRQDLPTNLQIRMPIIVIGGGLTAIDTACEAGVYYIEQIKKFATNVKEIGKENLFKKLNTEEKIIAEEFLANHAELVKSGSNIEFLKKLGGVKILYRKKIQDAPAYKHNHQELNKALEEGIEFVENTTPIKVNLDEFGHIKNLETDNGNFNCQSLLIAAGTAPNLSPFTKDGLDINSDKISFFGDATKKFEGNVVKAMASAKFGYKKISEKLYGINAGFKPALDQDFDCASPRDGFFTQLQHSCLEKINSDFLVKIEKVERLSNSVVEIFVKAPLLAKKTEVGHIFRLQNYHAFAKKSGDKLLAMEGVAVTALSIDKQSGIISCIVVETGGSTSLIKNFQAGEPCIFMGPSGKPTEIPKNEKVLLIGGGRGNQPLTALAEAFSANGCEVTFLAGYRKNEFIVRQERMENSCKKMIFAIEEKPNLELKNPLSLEIQGTVIDAIKKINWLNLSFDRIFTIGNDKMMHEIAKLRHENIVPALANARISITSLNAPMQCMLKGVCSQCLQKRKNEKGEMEYFYSCAEQDQDSDKLDFTHLHARCEQNSTLEKLYHFN